MLFSIVIPVYNVENYIVECLESIVNQSCDLERLAEILLIDDGSTDSSGIICDKYAIEYPDIIQVVHKKNEGLLLTRRTGFKKAKGKYIINCDSDDVLELDALSLLKDTLEQANYPDVVLFNYNLYDGKEKKAAFTNIFTELEDAIPVEKGGVFAEFLLHHSIVSMCGKVFKRVCLDLDKDYTAFGGLSHGEDSLQSFELYERSNSFVYINKALYNYRIGSGMTRKYDSNYFQTFKSIFIEIDKKKKMWEMDNYEEFFAVKVLSTAGRAITQSRYNRWGSVSSHINYLKKLSDDDLIQHCLFYLKQAKPNLQKDHYILLKLIDFHFYRVIILLLNIKNLQEKLLNEFR